MENKGLTLSIIFEAESGKLWRRFWKYKLVKENEQRERL